MKKYFFLFIICIFSISFATEEFESQQNYYRSYYKNYWTWKGVVVAVIDDGVWQEHPDLKWSEWVNSKEIPQNWIDDDKNGFLDDYFGYNFIDNSFDMTPRGWHATNVAGLIGAQINGKGIAGIAPDAKIMSLIVCNDKGCSNKNIINAIKYAVNNGANVINLSLWWEGYVGYSSDFDAVIKYAYEKNVIIVASAGNGDTNSVGQLWQNLDFLKASPVSNDVGGINMVIGVGAATAANNNIKTEWSNYGKSVDVWAQGEDVLTTANPIFTNKYWYSTVDGTSFSAPIVSGIVAIFRSAYPTLTPLEIIDIISSSPDPYNLNEMTKIKDSTQCNISRFNTVLNNWDSFVIVGEHFRNNQSFLLVRTDKDGIQTRINIDNWIRILDADKVSLNTSWLWLEPWIYSFKEANTKCWDSWNSLEIKGFPSGSNNKTSLPTAEIEDKSSSDADYLANNSIINKQNTTSAYRLLDKVLRQEVIGMAVKLGSLNLPDDYSCNGKFTDVTRTKPNNWACRAIEIAAEHSFISTSNTKFRPEDNITRVEALSILMKASGVLIQEFNGISKYSDVSLAWQINVVNTALIKGFIDSTDWFYPNRSATREEIFNMARRILEAR